MLEALAPDRMLAAVSAADRWPSWLLSPLKCDLGGCSMNDGHM